MAFDGIVLRAVTGELQDLIGSRIEKIYQTDGYTVLFHLYNRKNRCKLLLSAHPVNGRVHLTQLAYTNPLSPPLFCMILRKHLEGGKIVGLTQGENLERCLTISVEVFDELGDRKVNQLILEIMGKHSNLILVDGEKGTIIDGIKRYSHEVSRHREVLPGKAYVQPPVQNKLELIKVKEEEFRDALYGSALTSPLYKLLVKNFGGLSTFLAKELVQAAGLPLETTLNSMGQHEFSLLWQQIEWLAKKVSSNEFNPTVYTRDDQPLEFTAISFTGSQEKGLVFSSMNQALDFFYGKKTALEELAKEKHGLFKLLSQELERNYKKKGIQEKTIALAKEAEPYKIMGELVTANIYRIKKGTSEVIVENFYDPNYSLLTIPLKAELTPAQNAQLYFKKYNKAKAGGKKAEEQLLKTCEEIDYLESVVQSVEQADSLEEIEEIRQELVKEGYLKTSNSPSKSQKKRFKAQTEFLTYLSSDGFSILVGKNNKQNDLLTLKIAKDHDLWFHVKDLAGSHVIVKTQGLKVPESTLEEAALIAAYYSKGRFSSQVPVDWTQIKYVKKPQGTKPGKVIYENYKTVFVTPQQELLEKLKLKSLENKE